MSEEERDVVEAVKDKERDVAEAVKDKERDVAEAVKDKEQDVAEAVKDKKQLKKEKKEREREQKEREKREKQRKKQEEKERKQREKEERAQRVKEEKAQRAKEEKAQREKEEKAQREREEKGQGEKEDKAQGVASGENNEPPPPTSSAETEHEEKRTEESPPDPSSEGNEAGDAGASAVAQESTQASSEATVETVKSPPEASSQGNEKENVGNAGTTAAAESSQVLNEASEATVAEKEAEKSPPDPSSEVNGTEKVEDAGASAAAESLSEATAVAGSNSRPEAVTVAEPPGQITGCRQPIGVVFDATKAGEGTLTGTCTGAKVGSLPTKVKEVREGVYRVHFLPNESDIYMLSVQWGGTDVAGSPFTINLSRLPPASAVQVEETRKGQGAVEEDSSEFVVSDDPFEMAYQASRMLGELYSACSSSAGLLTILHTKQIINPLAPHVES